MIASVRQHNRHRTLTGTTTPMTIASGRTQAQRGSAQKHPPPGGGPRSAKLTPIQADVLELVRAAPRDCAEVGNALLIEFSTARWALDCLVNRSLIEEVHGYPTTWRAL